MNNSATTTSSSTIRPDWLTDAAWPYPVQRMAGCAGTISYTDVGTGPVLLFVHTGMWSILWRDVIDGLRDRFRCVTLDSPGCGLSDAAGRVDLTIAADAVDAVVRRLDLADLTLVVHDLGAPVALEAASRWPERVAALVVVNGFGWRPSGPMFRSMLAMMGNPVMREFDALTGWLPRASSSRFGVGRRWKRSTRKVFRRGVRRSQRRSFHRYMAAARRHDFTRIDAVVRTLANRPMMTIFGKRNDPLRFQPKWKQRFPSATQLTVPTGYHFPMCDDPALVVSSIARWHTEQLPPRG